MTQVLIIHCGKRKKIKRPIMQASPVRKQDRTWARNVRENADVFAEHLDSTFRPNEEKTLVNSRRTVKTQINRLPPTKPKEIINEIKTRIEKISWI